MTAASFLPCHACRFPADCESRGCYWREEQDETLSLSGASVIPLSLPPESGRYVASGCRAGEFVASAYVSSRETRRRSNAVQILDRRRLPLHCGYGMRSEKRFQFVWRMRRGSPCWKYYQASGMLQSNSTANLPLKPRLTADLPLMMKTGFPTRLGSFIRASREPLSIISQVSMSGSASAMRSAAPGRPSHQPISFARYCAEIMAINGSPPPCSTAKPNGGLIFNTSERSGATPSRGSIANSSRGGGESRPARNDGTIRTRPLASFGGTGKNAEPGTGVAPGPRETSSSIRRGECRAPILRGRAGPSATMISRRAEAFTRAA